MKRVVAVLSLATVVVLLFSLSPEYMLALGGNNGMDGIQGKLPPELPPAQASNEDEAYREARKRMDKELTDLANVKKNANLSADPKGSWGSGYSKLSNEFLDVAVKDNGLFSLGTTGGIPSIATDDYKKLLYGHPTPNTSWTTVRVDGYDYIFSSSGCSVSGDTVTAVMMIGNVKITQLLRFVSGGSVMDIQYSVENTDSASHSVGIRIMLDTMLSGNDGACFSIPGKGTISKEVEYTGNDIPSVWNVYDDLNSPTCQAIGTLHSASDENKPDKVQFAAWAWIENTYWDYTVSNTRSVAADSAVAVYFNPRSISAGNKTRFNTYYGVTLLSGTDAGHAIRTKSFNVFANQNGASSDTDRYAAASGAVLTINGATYTSDSSGVFSNVDISSGADATVTLAGYRTVTLPGSELASSSAIYLQKPGTDGVPVIESLALDGTNVLLHNATVYPGNSSRLRADIDWNGGSAGKVYLSQGATMVPLSANADSTVDVAGKFKREYPIYLVCANSQNQTAKKKLNITIGSAAPGTDGIPSNINMGLNAMADTSSIPLLGSLDSFGFGFELANLPVKFKVSGDSAECVFGKVNTDNYDQSVKDCIKEDFRQLQNSVNVAGRLRQIKTLIKPTNTKFITTKKVDVYVFGYGELTRDKATGKWSLTESGIGICVEDIKLGILFPFYLGPLPGYLKFQLELAAEAKGGVKVDPATGEAYFNAQFEISFEPSAAVGLGVEKVLAAEGGGKYAFKFKFGPKAGNWKAWDFSLWGQWKVYVDVKVGGNWHFPSFPWVFNLGRESQIWPGQGDRSLRPMNMDAVLRDAMDISAYKLVRNPYAGDPTVILPKAFGLNDSLNLSEQAEAVTLVQNEYSNARPQLMAIDSQSTLLVWVSRDGSRLPVNAPVIKYMVHDGSAWSEPKTIANAGVADDSIELVRAGGKIELVWQRESEALDADATFECAMSKMDICTALYDTVSGEFVNVTVMPDATATLDMLPCLYEDENGDEALLWVNNSANNPFGTTGVNRIMKSVWDGSSWSQPQELLPNVLPVNGIAADGDRVYYTADSSGARNSVNDSELYQIRDGAAERVTQNETIDSECRFTPLGFLWYSDGELLTQSEDGIIQPVIGRGILSGDRYDIRICEGVTYAYFLESNCDVSRVMASVYAGGQWQPPVEVASANGIIASFSCENSGGNTLAVLNEKDLLSFDDTAEYGPNNIILVTNPISGSLSVEDVSYNAQEIVPGSYLRMEYTLRNNGTASVRTGDVGILCGGVTEYSGDDSATLLPGESRTLSLYYMVPQDVSADARTIRVVYTDLGTGQQFTASTGLVIDKKDIAVTAVNYIAGASATDFFVEVRNKGLRAAEGITVNIRKGGRDASVEASGTIASISPNTAVILKITVPGALSASTNTLFLVEASALEGEAYLLDNDMPVDAYPDGSYTGTKYPMPGFRINYQLETTDAPVPETVEYKKSTETAWKSGDGNPLALLPGATAQQIQFRVKASGPIAASDVQTLTVPARPAISAVTAQRRVSALKLSGLAAGKTYEYICNDSGSATSNWNGATALTPQAASCEIADGGYRYVHIRLRCTASGFASAEKIAAAADDPNIVLRETFNQGSMPAGWSVASITGNANWYLSSGRGPDYSNCVHFNSFSSSSGSTAALVSPQFTVPAGLRGQVSFSLYHSTTYSSRADSVQLQYTVNQTTWVSVGQPILRYRSTSGWAQYTLYIPAGTNLRIRFLGLSQYGDNIFIDSIGVIKTPTVTCATTVTNTGIGKAAGKIVITSSGSLSGKYQYSKDNGKTWTASTTAKSWTYLNLSEGAYTVCVRDPSYSLNILKATAVVGAVLPAATGVSAVSSGYDRIMLKWKAVAGASKYYVYLSASATSGFARVTVSTGASAVVTGLVTNKLYYLKVYAVRVTAGVSTPGAASAAASARPVPSAPAPVTAASAAYNGIKLTWSAVSGASGYQIYRSTSSTGTYTYVAGTASTTYTNTGLETNRTYYYKVRAYRKVGSATVAGPYSAVISAKPVPAAPAALVASRLSPASARLTWGAVSGASGYEVYRAPSSGGTYVLVGTVGVAAFTNTGLSAGATYFYKVRAYRTVGAVKVYGSYSLVVSAAPQ